MFVVQRGLEYFATDTPDDFQNHQQWVGSMDGAAAFEDEAFAQYVAQEVGGGAKVVPLERWLNLSAKTYQFVKNRAFGMGQNWTHQPVNGRYNVKVSESVWQRIIDGKLPDETVDQFITRSLVLAQQGEQALERGPASGKGWN